MDWFTPRTLIEKATWCNPVGRMALALLMCWGSACRRHHLTPPATTGRGAYDTSPLNVSAFGQNESERRRILYMRFGEIATRLGSLRFEGHSQLHVGRGEAGYEQEDAYVVSQDSSGNFHLLFDTPASSLEAYLIGEDVFVRYDRGRLRQKTRRDMNAEALTDTAAALVAQGLEQFKTVAFSEPRPEQVDNRSALRYRVRLRSGPGDSSSGAGNLAFSRLALPLQAPPKWREAAQPAELTGFLSLDVSTGTVLRADYQGRLEVPEAGAAAQAVLLRVVTMVTQVGHVPPIKAPRAIAEFRRVPRDHDPLSFFRDQVPLPKPDESKPN